MALTLTNLVKRYVGPDGSIVPVVDIPKFELADAEQAALIGSSGSGKTTLLHLIAGILTPDSGQIIFSSGAGEKVDIVALSEVAVEARDAFYLLVGDLLALLAE